MAEVLQLNATVRESAGKGAARAVRREGRVPAVIYGGKEPPVTISLDRLTVEKQVDTGNFLSTLYMIEVDGKTTRVIPRDLQVDPVRDFPIHVDFLRLAKDATIAVEVSVNFINEEDSPGLKRGGILNIVRHAIELTCPAEAIPEAIEADLTGLEIGDSIHISDIKLPEGVEPTISDRDFTVATVAGAVAEEEEETEGEDEEFEEGVEGEEAAEAGDEEAGEDE